jgi:uncharacterized protein
LNPVRILIEEVSLAYNNYLFYKKTFVICTEFKKSISTSLVLILSTMNYDDLDKLNKLRQSGAITEEEFNEQKKRILSQPLSNQSTNLGMDTNTYCLLMHLAQLFPFAGWVISIVMWLVNKDKDPMVDQQGKVVVNWIITVFILSVSFALLSIVLIGIPLLILLAICNVIFVIIGTVKAASGEVWHYPISLSLIK